VKHARATDAVDHDHERNDDTVFAGISRILTMPIGLLTTLVSIVGFLLSIYLTFDRAVSAQQVQTHQVDQRVQKLEQRDEERSKTEAAVAAALVRIETKLDDVKERVERVENQKGGRR
jgi:predicted histidine transporter YuiF (NhaC family)